MSLDATTINPAAASAREAGEAGASSSGDLPSRAQYVVVGGGVIGTSIAYHLALLGATDVVLLERKQLTSGTTWHAAGEVVSGGTTEDALWMARYSAELYARLEEETGLSTGFRRCGYLQLATTPRADESFRRETAYMRSVGMTKEVLSPREVADLVPLMRTDDVIHGFWTPDEGRANPVDVTMSMAKGARQRGARIFENTEVTDFLLDGTTTSGGGRVVGVRIVPVRGEDHLRAVRANHAHHRAPRFFRHMHVAVRLSEVEPHVQSEDACRRACFFGAAFECSARPHLAARHVDHTGAIALPLQLQ